MGRPKRYKPYDPSKAPIHDRRTVDKLKDAQLAPIEIEDPLEAGGRLLVMRSTRDDPLADHHARGHIDEAQYQAGRAFQQDFERAERGPRAVGWEEAVDGGQMPEPLTEGQRKAAKMLARVYRELGADGSALTHDVLVHARTMRQVSESRGLLGRTWEEYFAKRFRECLNCLAVVYGFASK